MARQIVLIIRHADKPRDGDPAPGLTEATVVDPQSLTLAGWQRAGAWAALFGSGAWVDYPSPTRVYAADPTRSPDDKPPSKRPWQTVCPLAEKCGIKPIVNWAQGEEASLAKEAMAASGVTLIAWEHKRIIENLMPAFDIDPSGALPPRKWKGDRFDVVFRLDRDDAGERWRFRQMMPALMAGDPEFAM